MRIFFIVIIFFFTFLSVKDTDFGWHYRCGQNLISGKPCLSNNFSYFLPLYQAYYSSFIYDGLLALVYNRFGFLGVGFLGSVILTAGFVLFLRLLPIPFFFKIISFVLVYGFSLSTLALGLRSQTLSYVFFILTLCLLSRRKLLFILPAVFFLWANAHMGFFTGLILLLFFLFEKRNVKALLLFLLSFSATLINPFFIKIYLEIWRHFKMPLDQLIAEWTKPNTMQIASIILIFITALIFEVFSKKLSLFRLLSLLFVFYLAISARRNLPFFYTTAFYLVFTNAVILQLLKKIRLNETVINVNLPLLLLTGLFSFSVLSFYQNFQFNRSWNLYCQKGQTRYPCKMFSVLQLKNKQGNLFTAYEWGGFFIWQTPGLKVFIDGRMPAWADEKGRSPYSVYLYIIQAQKGWNEKLEMLKTDYLLIQNGTFLDLLLKQETQKYKWQEKYRNDEAVFYTKI